MCGCGPSKAQRDLHQSNLMMVAMAMREYSQQPTPTSPSGSFPPAASRDEDGKPLLSWRVALLPYLEQQALYDRFHHDEPWDSPHNIKLLEEMPEVYRVPWEENNGKTRLMVFVGKGTPFGGQDGIDLRRISDGASNTIMFVEAGANKAVAWTKPENLPFNTDNPIAEMGDLPGDRFSAVFFDGYIHTIEKDIDPKTLCLLIQHKDGQPIDTSKVWP